MNLCNLLEILKSPFYSKTTHTSRTYEYLIGCDIHVDWRVSDDEKKLEGAN
jgi:hypothetical protein